MPGHTSGGVLRTQANQFRNRRTGILVPAGVPYHIHPDRGPMQGAQHNPNIPGGTSGHDFFDPVSGANTTSGMSTRMSTRSQRASSRSTMGGSGGGYRRGGRTRGRTRGRRRFEHGGMHSCPPGQMMQNGGCVPISSGGGYRRGGSTRRRMRHGGHTHQVSAHHMSEAARLATFHYHGDAGAPFPTYIGNMGHDMYEQMNLPQYQSNYNIPESSHHHGRHGRTGISTTQMRRGGSTRRRMMHGGPHQMNTMDGGINNGNGNGHDRRRQSRDNMGRSK